MLFPLLFSPSVMSRNTVSSPERPPRNAKRDIASFTTRSHSGPCSSMAIFRTAVNHERRRNSAYTIMQSEPSAPVANNLRTDFSTLSPEESDRPTEMLNYSRNRTGYTVGCGLAC